MSTRKALDRRKRISPNNFRAHFPPIAAMDPTGAVSRFADASGLFLPLVATLNAARVPGSIAGLLGVDHDGLARLALEAEPGSAGVVLVP